MASLKLFTLTVVLLLAKVHSGTMLSSDEEPVSSRVNHLSLNSSFLSLKPLNSTRSACFHFYGFLPCATNVPGYIFQIAVLEFLLLAGDKILTKGRNQLFSLLGVGIYGASVFRILQVLPNIVIVLGSGLAKNKEDAKVTIENGVGTLAGSTVFYLTLQWGICVVLGRTKLAKLPVSQTQSQPSKSSKCLVLKRKLSNLKEYGVETDKETSYVAGIMLLSLVPFILVELATLVKCPPWSHMVTLTISCIGLVSYFVFQSKNQWIQQRSLEYSRDQLLLAGFLNHLQKFAKRRLVDDDGKASASCIRRTFSSIDKNDDKQISQRELSEFVEQMDPEKLGLDHASSIDELMAHFDKDSNTKISEDEFLDGCQRYINNAKQIVVDKLDSSKQYLPWLHKMIKPWIHKQEKLVEIEKQLSETLKTAKNQQLACLFTDGKPDEVKIRSLFEEFDTDKDGKMTVQELKRMVMTKFQSAKFDHESIAENFMRVFDQNDDEELHENEFLDGLRKRLSDDAADSQEIARCIEKEKRSIKKMSWRSLTKALVRVIIGVAIVSSLVLPLIKNTQLLSESIGIPSFFVSFVVLPFAVNFKTAMAIFPATNNKEGAASIMFSEIYGAVFMNNTLGLITLVGLIWARGFSWEYSSEVLVIWVVGAIIGAIAYWHKTYPFWTCILAFSLYPLSLVLFYVFRYLVGWK